jgi:alpha-L-fucosidase
MAGQFGGARDVRPYTAQDIRFTRKGDVLYAFVMDWPTAPVALTSLAASRSPGRVQRVDLLGGGTVPFTQSADALTVTLPATRLGEHALALRISGLRLDG